jgi:heat shock protein beta
MKKGQDQILYLSGGSMDEIKKSPFLERVTARGFEVLYMDDPIDEYITQHVHKFEDFSLQSVAKDGLKLGDDDQQQLKDFETKFEPLKQFFLAQFGEKYNIEKVVVSNRLTTTPCAIVASQHGWSGHQKKLMESQALGTGQGAEYLNLMEKVH